MPPTLEAVTTAALSLALEAASLRQQALAANIANAEAAGWHPLAVDFEGQLAQARSELAEQGQVQPATLAAIHPVLQQAQPGQGVAAPLDAQLAELARNAVQYQALAQGLSRQLGLLALAAADGRR